MKKLITETQDGYRVYADLFSVPDPSGYTMLKITTQWDNAKNPEDEQVKFTQLLSPTALENLYQLLKDSR
jgi:hypothetical protein